MTSKSILISISLWAKEVCRSVGEKAIFLTNCVTLTVAAATLTIKFGGRVIVPIAGLFQSKQHK